MTKANFFSTIDKFATQSKNKKTTTKKNNVRLFLKHIHAAVLIVKF